MSDRSGSHDAEYSNDVVPKAFTFNGPDNTGWIANAVALFWVNNTAVIVYVNNFPIQPGGTLPMGELRKGVYDKPITVNFASEDTGTVWCICTLKGKREIPQQ